MRHYRFFTQDLTDESMFGEEVVLGNGVEGEILNQLGKVLRVKAGDEVVLIPPGQSPPYYEFHYEVGSAHKKEVVLKLRDKIDNKNELEFGLELVLCLPNKPDKLAFMLQKAVELGVSKITLVQGKFSQMKHELREDRLKKIMKEAAEQSERAYVPDLATGGKLIEYLDGNIGRLLVAMEREDSESLQEVVKGISGDLSVLIGPEGGFSDDEKKSVRAHRLKTFTLGTRILRMETAVILALGMAGCYK
jgi:16S rRNA (uracil1498-N3)-methyltransferase